MRCHRCCIHMCFFGLHIPQLHSLGQPVPASLMHKRAEPVRHALTQATHVVVLVDPAHGLLQTLFQLARCLLPMPDRPCLLLQSSQPGHRALVQQEVCNVGWLSMRALLRICASPKLESVLTASRLVIAGDRPLSPVVEAGPAVCKHCARLLRGTPEHLSGRRLVPYRNSQGRSGVSS